MWYRGGLVVGDDCVTSGVCGVGGDTIYISVFFGPEKKLLDGVNQREHFNYTMGSDQKFI